MSSPERDRILLHDPPELWEEPQGAARQTLICALARLIAEELAEEERRRAMRRPCR